MRRRLRPSPWLPLILAVALLGCDGLPAPLFGGEATAPTAETPAAAEPARGPDPVAAPAPTDQPSPVAAASAPIGEQPAAAAASSPITRAPEPRPAPQGAQGQPDMAMAADEEEKEEDEAAERAADEALPRQPSRGIVLSPASNAGSAIRPGQVTIGGIRAARIFAGPGQYPPSAFAAYGILAFPSRAAPADMTRQTMLCNAYIAALPHSTELALPLDQQMVTVWPLNDDKVADDLNAEASSEVCETAIRNYHLPAALQAIRDAGPERIGRAARGPFLLAWSPANAKGSPTAPVLMADLSDVTTYEQARAIFVLWRTDIEANPEYWEGGWDLERLRTGIRLWVDRVGQQIFSIIGA